MGVHVPVTQSWALGEWGVGAFLAAFLLMPLGIGVVIFLFLVVGHRADGQAGDPATTPVARHGVVGAA